MADMTDRGPRRDGGAPRTWAAPDSTVDARSHVSSVVVLEKFHTLSLSQEEMLGAAGRPLA